MVTHEATVKGTQYRKGTFVLIDRNEEGLIFGQIQLILIHRASAVYFITKKCQSVYLADQGVHCVESVKKAYCCVDQERLLDYYPLPDYKVHGLTLMVLHHCPLSEE